MTDPDDSKNKLLFRRAVLSPGLLYLCRIFM